MAPDAGGVGVVGVVVGCSTFITGRAPSRLLYSYPYYTPPPPHASRLHRPRSLTVNDWVYVPIRCTTSLLRFFRGARHP